VLERGGLHGLEGRVSMRRDERSAGAEIEAEAVYVGDRVTHST
jgi:hypothetical protein